METNEKNIGQSACISVESIIKNSRCLGFIRMERFIMLRVNMSDTLSMSQMPDNAFRLDYWSGNGNRFFKLYIFFTVSMKTKVFH